MVGLRASERAHRRRPCGRRLVRRAVMSGAAAAALAFAPAPALAQPDALGTQIEVNLRELRIQEMQLHRAEEARLNGECLRVREIADNFLYYLHRGWTRGADLPPHAKAEMERRMREILALDCPPRSSTSAGPATGQPPTATGHATQPAGAPTSSTGDGATTTRDPEQPGPDGFGPILDELGDDAPAPVGSTGTPAPVPARGSEVDRTSVGFAQGALNLAIRDCDRAAYEDAKRRILVLLNALIQQEPDLERRQELMRQRGAAQSGTFPDPCPPTEPRTGIADESRIPFPWETEGVGVAVGVEYRKEQLSIPYDDPFPLPPVEPANAPTSQPSTATGHAPQPTGAAGHQRGEVGVPKAFNPMNMFGGSIQRHSPDNSGNKVVKGLNILGGGNRRSQTERNSPVSECEAQKDCAEAPAKARRSKAKTPSAHDESPNPPRRPGDPSPHPAPPG